MSIDTCVYFEGAVQDVLISEPVRHLTCLIREYEMRRCEGLQFLQFSSYLMTMSWKIN